MYFILGRKKKKKKKINNSLPIFLPMHPQRQLLVLDSKFRTNPEDKDHLYKFKLNARIRFNGKIKLEQLIFQNSQNVFSSEKKTEDGNPLPVTINIKGMFNNTDAFVKGFNEVMSSNGIQIRMTYVFFLFEIKIQHLGGTKFSLEEYYGDGTFMDLIGFSRLNQGNNVYTNVDTPKLFSQRLIFISIPELGTSTFTTKAMQESGLMD